MRWMVLGVVLMSALPCWAGDGEYEIKERDEPFGSLTGDRSWSVEEHGRERLRIEYDEPIGYDPNAAIHFQKPTYKVYDCEESGRC